MEKKWAMAGFGSVLCRIRAGAGLCRPGAAVEFHARGHVPSRDDTHPFGGVSGLARQRYAWQTANSNRDDLQRQSCRPVGYGPDALAPAGKMAWSGARL